MSEKAAQDNPASSTAPIGINAYPDKKTSDTITLNDFYSSMGYSESTLSERQQDMYQVLESVDYCQQQAVKIVGDAKLGQTSFIERLCSLNLLKGSTCLKKYVSFNAEETPNRLSSSKKDYGQFYYNLMHCQDKDEETIGKYKEMMKERGEFSGDGSHLLSEDMPDVFNNLTLKNIDLVKEAFSKVNANSEDRTRILTEEVRKRFAQPQFDNLIKCAKDRYLKSNHEEDTFGLSQNNVNELAHKCFVPYYEYFTRLGSVVCRRQIESCLALGKKQNKVQQATAFYLHTCMTDDMVASCMKYPEQYFIDQLED